MARRSVCTAAACLDRGSRAHGELRGAVACLGDRTRPTSRRMASPAAAPGPVQGSSAQPPASGRFWGLVDVPKARIPSWPRLETGPPQDWTRPLCAQQPGLVLALRRPLNSGVLPTPPGSPSDPGSVTKAGKATLLRSGPSPCGPTGSATGRGHGGSWRRLPVSTSPRIQPRLAALSPRWAGFFVRASWCRAVPHPDPVVRSP